MEILGFCLSTLKRNIKSVNNKNETELLENIIYTMEREVGVIETKESGVHCPKCFSPFVEKHAREPVWQDYICNKCNEKFALHQPDK